MPELLDELELLEVLELEEDEELEVLLDELELLLELAALLELEPSDGLFLPLPQAAITLIKQVSISVREINIGVITMTEGTPWTKGCGELGT